MNVIEAIQMRVPKNTPSQSMIENVQPSLMMMGKPFIHDCIHVYKIIVMLLDALFFNFISHSFLEMFVTQRKMM